MSYAEHIPIYGHTVYYDTIRSDEFGDLPIEERLAYSINHSISTVVTTVAIDMLLFGGRAEHGFGYVRHIPTAARASPLMIPAALALANYEVIGHAPPEQQTGLWQMFSSGLTGTFGIGSGLNL